MAAAKTASKAATKTVEVADVVEDIVETATDVAALTEEKISWLKANPKIIMFSVGLGSALLGGAVTYLVVSKKLRAKWQAYAEEQIESVKSKTNLITKTGPEGDLAKLAEKYGPSDDIVAGSGEPIETVNIPTTESVGNRVQYDKITPTSKAVQDLVEKVKTGDLVPEVIERNIFESDDPATYFNFEEELLRREQRPNEPFVITNDEFDANETDADQYHLTYYDEDDVLVDQADNVISAIDEVVGRENLLRFGHGSGDKEIVFVRNTKLDQDMEVTMVNASYAKEVLGIADDQTAELRHSRNRRGRFHDE